MKPLHFFLAIASIAVPSLGLGIAANAQSMAPPPYVDSACGAWHADTWVPSGTCSKPLRHQRVAGTIVAVKGHLVTVQLASRQLVINDTPALNNQLSGRVAVGRQIVAHGYWRAGTFYATLITTGPIAPK